MQALALTRTMVQMLALVIICIVIFDIYIHHFNHYSFIQALQYVTPAGYLLIEQLIFNDKDNTEMTGMLAIDDAAVYLTHDSSKTVLTVKISR